MEIRYNSFSPGLSPPRASPHQRFDSELAAAHSDTLGHGDCLPGPSVGLTSRALDLTAVFKGEGRGGLPAREGPTDARWLHGRIQLGVTEPTLGGPPSEAVT